MSVNSVLSLMLLALLSPLAPAEIVLPAPPDGRAWLAFPDGLSGAADPLRFLIDTAQKQLQVRKEPDSREAWLARVPDLKQALAQRLGLDPMPPKTPLNARITGRAERTTYFIENLVFESQPGLFVTANVYVPKSASLPAPAVVVAAGHAMEEGKNRDLYQLGQLSLVKQGMIVLAFDPIGQGERKRPGFAHDLGYGSLLVGQTNEGRIVWDAIRSVDYLVSRADVDPTRIGITGNSGGGELVFYAMPLDSRIRAGASFCFVCSYEQWIEKGGNHCICNHLPGITRAMEEFEIIGLNAPRPFLAGNGAEDTIFPIEGVRETLRRAGTIYGMMGASDRIHGVEAPYPHGWTQPLREAGTAWLSHWLLGQDRVEAIPETGIAAEDPLSGDLQALKSGSMPAGSETVVTLNQKLAANYRAKYSAPPGTAETWEAQAPAWRQAIWQVIGGRPEAFTPSARIVNSFDWENLRVEVLTISVESGLEIAATLATPISGAPAGDAHLFVGGFESRGSAIREGRAARAANQGPVLVIDPRGSGETARNLNQLVSDGIVVGRPLFAQQVWDVVQAARWLATRHGAVTVHGAEDGAMLAAYAAALEAPFAGIELENLLASYQYYLEDEQPQSILLSLPNILKVVDIPQILALAGPTPRHINGVIGFGKAKMDTGAALRALDYPLAVERQAGRLETLQIQ